MTFKSITVLLLDFCFIVVTFGHTSFITRARNLFLKEKAGLLLLDPWKQGIDIYKKHPEIDAKTENLPCCTCS